jgi:hypothetical protein
MEKTLPEPNSRVHYFVISEGDQELFDLALKVSGQQHKDNSVKVITARNL